jgi:hypothetical protein
MKGYQFFHLQVHVRIEEVEVVFFETVQEQKGAVRINVKIHDVIPRIFEGNFLFT